MRRVIFSLFLSIGLAAATGPALAEQYVVLMNRLLAQGQGLFQPALEARLFQLVNAYRQGRGLRPLVEDPALKAPARAHALDMAQQGRLGHVASSGHDFDSRMHALRPGVMVLPDMSENAAMWGHADGGVEQVAQQLFKAWLDSAPHRRTLVSRDYVRAAMGAVIVHGQAYADQIFAGPEVQTNLNAAPAAQGPQDAGACVVC